LVGAVAATRQAGTVGWMSALGAGGKLRGVFWRVLSCSEASKAGSERWTPTVESERALVERSVDGFGVRAVCHEMTTLVRNMPICPKEYSSAMV